MKSFYWILGIIVIFAGFIGAAAYFKNQSATSDDVPGITTTATDHVLGNGPVTLTEYADFQCPACKMYFPVVEELLKQKGADITYVYRDFPLAQHYNAYPSAQAAEAAANQGKFFEMYRILFEKQDEWANLSASAAFDKFKDYAATLSLDADKFASDYALRETKTKIQNLYRSGVNLEVNQTPTFFVNGKKIDSPASNVEAFIQIINNAKNGGSGSVATSTSPIDPSKL